MCIISVLLFILIRILITESVYYCKYCCNGSMLSSNKVNKKITDVCIRELPHKDYIDINLNSVKLSNSTIICCLGSRRVEKCKDI